MFIVLVPDNLYPIKRSHCSYSVTVVPYNEEKGDKLSVLAPDIHFHLPCIAISA